MNYLDNGALLYKNVALRKNPSMNKVLIKFEKKITTLHFLKNKCKFISSQIVIDVSLTTTCQVMN